MENLAVRIPTRKFTPVQRVPGGVSLRSTGVLVEKIDSEIPTLYDCLARILEPQMVASEWKKLTENIPLYKKVKKGACVFILSENAVKYYNCLISNVHTPTERTGLTQLLYTDDEEFNVRALPRLTKDWQYDEVKNGLVSYIKPDRTYVIKTSTHFTSGPNLNHTETTVDYLFYIPATSIFEGVR